MAYLWCVPDDSTVNCNSENEINNILKCILSVIKSWFSNKEKGIQIML